MSSSLSTPRVLSAAATRPWRSWLGDAVLVALMAGPVAAPFLRASGIMPLEVIANIIYFMGQRVCPQPELGLALSPPHIMAVCLRCYGTLLGLLLMRLAYGRDRGRSAYWLEQYGLWGFGLTFALCMVYPAELALQGFDWWPVDPARMTLFGWISGLGLGAYLMPVLHHRNAP